MICPNCGRNIPDGSVCPCSTGGPALSSNPALNAIKTIGSSSRFLVAAILMTAVPVLSIIGSTFFKPDLSALMSLMYEMDLDPEIYYYAFSSVNRVSVVSAVFSALPAILVAVALWLVYTTCGNRQSGNISTAGLTICKVLAVLSLILYSLLAVLLAVGFVILIIAAAAEGLDYYDNGSGAVQAVIVICVVALVVVLGIMALFICYQASILKTINRIKATALSGVPDNRVPGFLIGMNWVVGVCGGISGLFALFTSPVAGVAALLGAAALIVFALLLSQYRKAMTMLLYPPVQPTYPQQPMPPQGPWA